ncbi:acyltransferase [Humibacter sp.]|uniref:acyltransferase family protein n=1 Tax=Humibacter sp. TaxID=1940291 RepID=UPI002BCC094E|nr:acyltransferase [Humibacter sp.]HVX07324.1 acyltransferase [Humibacter sp.]
MTGTRGDVDVGQPSAHLRAGRRRLDHIDAIRAVAALFVFFLHVRGFWLPRPSGHGLSFIVDRIAAQGAAGVDVFVVLSGFCLTYPLVLGQGATFRRLWVSAFYKRRALRLLPAYYAVLIVVVALEMVPSLARRLVGPRPSATDIVANALLLQPFDNHTLGSVNGPMWSISLEFQLYLLFPVMLWLVTRSGWRVTVGGTILLAFGTDVVGRWYDHHHAASALSGLYQFSLPAHLFQFVLGMLAASLLARRAMVPLASTAVGGVVALAVGAVGTIAGEEFLRTFGYGVFAATLVIIGSAIPDRFFEGASSPLRALTRLGLVSFSFYLVHQPVILLLGGLAGSLVGHATIPLYLLGAALAVALWGVAAVLFRVLEEPFLRRGSMLRVTEEASGRGSSPQRADRSAPNGR